MTPRKSPSRIQTPRFRPCERAFAKSRNDPRLGNGYERDWQPVVTFVARGRGLGPLGFSIVPSYDPEPLGFFQGFLAIQGNGPDIQSRSACLRGPTSVARPRVLKNDACLKPEAHAYAMHEKPVSALEGLFGV